MTSTPSDDAIKLEKDYGFSSAAIGGGVGTLNKVHPSSADINVSQNSTSPTGSIAPSEGRLSPIEDSTTLARKKARFVIK